MPSLFKPLRSPLLLVCAVTCFALTTWASAQDTATASTCTLPDAIVQKLDFSNSTASCQIDPTTTKVDCGTCLCQMGRILYTQLQADGVDVSGVLGAGNTAAVTNFFSACRTTLGVQLLTTSGLPTDNLLQLQDCAVNSIPDTCFSDLLPSASANTTAAAPTTTATTAVPAPSPTAPPPLPAAPPAPAPPPASPAPVATPSVAVPVESPAAAAAAPSPAVTSPPAVTTPPAPSPATVAGPSVTAQAGPPDNGAAQAAAGLWAGLGAGVLALLLAA